MLVAGRDRSPAFPEQKSVCRFGLRAGSGARSLTCVSRAVERLQVRHSAGSGVEIAHLRSRAAERLQVRHVLERGEIAHLRSRAVERLQVRHVLERREIADVPLEQPQRPKFRQTSNSVETGSDGVACERRGALVPVSLFHRNSSDRDSECAGASGRTTRPAARSIPGTPESRKPVFSLASRTVRSRAIVHSVRMHGPCKEPWCLLLRIAVARKRADVALVTCLVRQPPEPERVARSADGVDLQTTASDFAFARGAETADPLPRGRTAEPPGRRRSRRRFGNILALHASGRI